MMFIRNFIFIFSILFYFFSINSHANELKNSTQKEIKKNKIIIIGDSISCNILKNNNKYDIKNYCKVSSGLVNIKYYNYFDNTYNILSKEKFSYNDFVIILVGTNDNAFYNNYYKEYILTYKNYIKKNFFIYEKNIIFIQSPNSFNEKLKNIEKIREEQNIIYKENNYIKTYFDKEFFINDLIHLNNKAYDILDYQILEIIKNIEKSKK